MQSRHPQTTTWVQTLIAAGVLTLSAAAQSHNVSSVNDSMAPTSDYQTPTRSGQGDQAPGMADASPDRQPGMNDRGQADTMNTGQAGDYGSANYETPSPTDARDPMKDDPVDQDTDPATNQPDQNSDDNALPDRGTPDDDASESGMTGASPNAMSDNHSGTDDAADQTDNMDPHTSGTTIDN